MNDRLLHAMHAMHAMHALRAVRVVLCALIMTMTSASARADFHLWEIDQVFSDATGNVQYIRFNALAGGQQFLSGHNVVTSLAGGPPTKTYVFTTNLPGDTTGKKFLLATQGFAALNIVTPDYVVPNGFLFKPDGTINFAGVEVMTYGSLPSNGTQAIDGAGNIVTATPVNFAGQTGPVNVPPPAQAGAMDIDHNGKVDALTDGLLLIRYAFGLRGAALVSGAIGAGALRNTAQAIEAYLGGCFAQTGATC